MFFSAAQTLLLLTGATSLVSAHGNVNIALGNAGGASAALGIYANGTVPGTGSRTTTTAADGTKILGTEVDTTVYNGVAVNGCGASAGNGTIKPATMIANSLAVAGSDQIVTVTSPGYINFTWHTVVLDGAMTGMSALMDPTGTCAYATAKKFTFSIMPPAVTTSQAQGSAGSDTAINAALPPRSLGLFGRASNIFRRANNNLNIDSFQFAQVAVPAGLTPSTCTGTSPQLSQPFCILKLVNNAGNGNFGGNVVFAIAPPGGASSVSVPLAPAPAAPAPSGTAPAPSGAKPAPSGGPAVQVNAALSPTTCAPASTVTVTVTIVAAPTGGPPAAVYVGNYANPAGN